MHAALKRMTTLLLAGLLCGGAGVAAATAPECIAPAKPGGGFDLTCKLMQKGLQKPGVDPLAAMSA